MGYFNFDSSLNNNGMIASNTRLQNWTIISQAIQNNKSQNILCIWWWYFLSLNLRLKFFLGRKILRDKRCDFVLYSPQNILARNLAQI